MNATLQFLCNACHQETTFQQEITTGNNVADITCSGCGERWHLLFEVLKFEPLTVGNWRIRRAEGGYIL